MKFWKNPKFQKMFEQIIKQIEIYSKNPKLQKTNAFFPGGDPGTLRNSFHFHLKTIYLHCKTIHFHWKTIRFPKGNRRRVAEHPLQNHQFHCKTNHVHYKTIHSLMQACLETAACLMAEQFFFIPLVVHSLSCIRQLV